MSDIPADAAGAAPVTDRIRKGLGRRHAAERRFRAYGVIALLIGLGFLIVLFTSIISRGWTAFLQSSMHLEVVFDQQEINPSNDPMNVDELFQANYVKLARN